MKVLFRHKCTGTTKWFEINDVARYFGDPDKWPEHSTSVETIADDDGVGLFLVMRHHYVSRSGHLEAWFSTVTPVF